MDNKRNKLTHVCLGRGVEKQRPAAEAICQQHDLKLSTFGYWIALKKRTQEPSGGFLSVDVNGRDGQQLQIIYPNRVRISVDTDCPAY